MSRILPFFVLLSASAILGYQPSLVARVRAPSTTINHQPFPTCFTQQNTHPSKNQLFDKLTKQFAAESTAEPDEAQLEEWYQEMAEARKIMTMVGYRFTAIVYMFLSLFLIVSNASKSLASLPLTCYVVAGPMLASGVSYVLEGAAVNERFFSGTYKRLNIFLGFYGFFWLIASFFARHTQSKVLLNPIVITASLAVVVNSFKAWTYGVKGWRKNPNISRLGELLSGSKESVKILFRVKNLNGATYLAATALVGCIKMSKLVELIELIMDRTTEGAMLAKTIFRYSTLFLLTGVMFTLKDAADRDRLRSISFIELNTIAAYVLGVMGSEFRVVNLFC